MKDYFEKKKKIQNFDFSDFYKNRLICWEQGPFIHELTFNFNWARQSKKATKQKSGQNSNKNFVSAKNGWDFSRLKQNVNLFTNVHIFNFLQ